jgi:hypothetical protein
MGGAKGILPGTGKNDSGLTTAWNVFDPMGGQQRSAQDSANAAADLAGRAAMDQQREARRSYMQTAGIVNQATVQGLASLDRDIANQERNLARQEKMISMIDPTILEASQQALRLLRGETSSTLAPMQQQRDQQRQKLLNQLREQLGPGAETSSAGMQALSRFDSESSQLFAGAQQQALGNLTGIAGQFSNMRPDMLRDITGLSGFGQAKTGLEYQRAGVLGGARQGLYNTAGAQYTGRLLGAQADQAGSNQMLNAGIQAGMAYFTGGSSLMGGMGGGQGGGGQSQMMAGQSNMNRMNLA